MNNELIFLEKLYKELICFIPHQKNADLGQIYVDSMVSLAERIDELKEVEKNIKDIKKSKLTILAIDYLDEKWPKKDSKMRGHAMVLLALGQIAGRDEMNIILNKKDKVNKDGS